jgi:hypothetical protein
MAGLLLQRRKSRGTGRKQRKSMPSMTASMANSTRIGIEHAKRSGAGMHHFFCRGIWNWEGINVVLRTLID